MPGSFIDTNVLVYLASGSTEKANRAETLVAAGGTISIQVLNELANVARRKMSLSWAQTRDVLLLVRGLLDVVPLTIQTHETALDLAERYGFGFYDATIVGAAVLAGCRTLWSEDMQHGMRVRNRLRIANPFALSEEPLER